MDRLFSRQVPPERRDATSAIFHPREQSIRRSRWAYILSCSVEHQPEAGMRGRYNTAELYFNPWLLETHSYCVADMDLERASGMYFQNVLLAHSSLKLMMLLSASPQNMRRTIFLRIRRHYKEQKRGDGNVLGERRGEAGIHFGGDRVRNCYRCWVYRQQLITYKAGRCTMAM